MLCAENRDVTDEEVLANPAAQSGLEQDRCLPAFRSDEARDVAIAQGAGIAGFPTLIAGVGDGAEYALVTQGCHPSERIAPIPDRWLQAG